MQEKKLGHLGSMGGMTPNKHTPGFALVALLGQITSWNQSGNDALHFGALTEHPETDDDCTVRDLIAPAWDELAKLKVDREALLEALKALFEHCVMVHKQWGDGCNIREANAAIAAGRAAIAKAEGN